MLFASCIYINFHFCLWLVQFGPMYSSCIASKRKSFPIVENPPAKNPDVVCVQRLGIYPLKNTLLAFKPNRTVTKKNNFQKNIFFILLYFIYKFLCTVAVPAVFSILRKTFHNLQLKALNFWISYASLRLSFTEQNFRYLYFIPVSLSLSSFVWKIQINFMTKG